MEKVKLVVLGKNEADFRFIKEAFSGTAESSFEIKEVNDTEELIKLMGEYTFDIVLFSFSFAEDSLDTITQIKKICHYAPLVLMVDVDKEEEVSKCIEMGADECIIKDEVNRKQLRRDVLLSFKRYRRMKSLFEKINYLVSVEETLRRILEENTEPIIIVDVDGVIRFANYAAESLFGRDKKGLEGEMFEFCVNPHRTTEIEITRSYEKRVLLEMRAIPIEWQKEIAYLVWLHNITGLVQIREELRAMSLVDDLTGLFNDKGFILLGEQQIKLSNRTKKGMYIIYIDVVHLQDINRSYGPYEGDAALVDMASLLRDTFRRSDIIARIGDDEFVVLAVEAERNSGDIICSRFLKNVERFNASEGRKYKLSVDIKKFYYDPSNPVSFDELLNRIIAKQFED